MQKLLIQAIKTQDIITAANLIKDGADVNWIDSDANNIPPLIWAVILGESDEMIKLLIANAADVNIKDHEGKTPLMHAASQGKCQAIECLLTHGANINDADETGLTALFMSLKLAKSDVVKLLLDKGADYNAYDSFEYTPVMEAFPHKELVMLLIQQAKNDNNFLSVNLSFFTQINLQGVPLAGSDCQDILLKEQLLTLLIESKLTLNFVYSDPKLQFNCKIKYNAFFDFIRYLCDRKIKIHHSLLSAAIINNQIKIVTILLHKGIYINVDRLHADILHVGLLTSVSHNESYKKYEEFTTWKNAFPLHYAAMIADMPQLTNLLENNYKTHADRNILDNHKQTPLMYAKKYNDLDTIIDLQKMFFSGINIASINSTAVLCEILDIYQAYIGVCFPEVDADNLQLPILYYIIQNEHATAAVLAKILTDYQTAIQSFQAHERDLKILYALVKHKNTNSLVLDTMVNVYSKQTLDPRSNPTYNAMIMFIIKHPQLKLQTLYQLWSLDSVKINKNFSKNITAIVEKFAKFQTTYLIRFLSKIKFPAEINHIIIKFFGLTVIPPSKYSATLAWLTPGNSKELFTYQPSSHVDATFAVMQQIITMQNFLTNLSNPLIKSVVKEALLSDNKLSDLKDIEFIQEGDAQIIESKILDYIKLGIQLAKIIGLLAKTYQINFRVFSQNHEGAIELVEIFHNNPDAPMYDICLPTSRLSNQMFSLITKIPQENVSQPKPLTIMFNKVTIHQRQVAMNLDDYFNQTVDAAFQQHKEETLQAKKAKKAKKPRNIKKF